MTNRTDHVTRGQALPGKTRQVALAASVALVAVTGTAAIAWPGLSLSFGPALSAQATPAAEPGPRMHMADTRGFVAATRDLAAAPGAAPETRNVVVLSTQSREEQRLGNAVQPKLFGGGAASARTPSAVRPSAAVQAEEARTLRPVARPAADPAPVVAADPAPVTVAAVTPRARTAPASQPRIVVANSESRGESRLHRLWNVGLFR